MNHPAILRGRPSPGLHAGAVSLLRLLDLYGESHRAELDELWAAPGTDYLALFADDAGRDCAILPVGPAHEYRNLDTVLGLRIEGLHAVCYTPARDVTPSPRRRRRRPPIPIGPRIARSFRRPPKGWPRRSRPPARRPIRCARRCGTSWRDCAKWPGTRRNWWCANIMCTRPRSA